MGFKVTIVETKSVERETDGQYCIIDRRPMTEKEFNESSEVFQVRARGGGEKLEAKHLMREVFGYPPRRKEIKTDEVKVFEQQVDELDLKAVIRAINSLP